MAPATALCLILLALSLWLQREKDKEARTVRFGKACAAFVLVFSSLTLFEHAAALDFGIDRWFFAHRLSDWTLNSPPGRMAWNTALVFALLALALLLLDKKWKEQPLPEILSLTAGLIAFFGIVGYWYGVPYIHTVAFVLRMALHTAITVIVLSTGVFFARTEEGYAALLVSRDVSGVIARRLLGAVVLVLPLLGWLKLKAAAAGIVEVEFGGVLFVSAAVAVLSILSLDTARRLRRLNIEGKALEARHLLAAIVESSDDAIYSKNLEGIITTWNKGAERLYGYAAAEAIGCSISLIVPPEHLEELRDLLQCIRRGERVERHEAVRMCKDGRLLHVTIAVAPVTDERGEITGSSVVAHDITRRKQAEESIAHLASFPELNPAPVFETDMEGKITYANPPAVKIVQSGQAEAVLRDWGSLIELFKAGREERITRTIEVDGSHFLQAVCHLPKLEVVRAYQVDITGLKRPKKKSRNSTPNSISA